MGALCFTRRVRKTRVPKGCKLPHDQHKYDGSQESTLWLSDYLQAVKILVETKATAMQSLQLHLTGAARSLLNTLPNESMGSWGELESQFTRYFCSTYKRPASLEEVKACAQRKGETLRSYIQRWSIIKNSAEDVSDERAIDAFLAGLHRSDLVEEIGRTRCTTVAKLMEQANKFADGEDAYNNKRGRSPEVDIISRQKKRHRSRDNQGRRNQVATGYVPEEEERYESRRFQAKGEEKLRYSGPSAEDMLYGPCRIHYTYLHGKRVSNHQMKDCRTFLRLQSAMGSSQSGGLIVLWNSSIFTGTILEIHRSAIRMQFTSTSNNLSWQLVNVYGPCKGLERDIFVQWLHDLDIPHHDNWLLMGDFNFIRSVDNRNKPGADMNDIFLFNSIISHLGLVELPLKGRAFTWSNMQDSPLLQQIDWFFTSCQWSLSFPNTEVLPLAKSTSDHVPCIVKIATTIPKARIFRFENHWIQQSVFFELVERVWKTPVKPLSASGIITAKLKNLRYELKRWGKIFITLRT
jgi:hypothetical protein